MDRDFGSQTPTGTEAAAGTLAENTGKPVTDAAVSGDRVVYKFTNESHFKETRALFIGNLGTEFDTEKFKDILMTRAKENECTIERAWLNSNRSHCYVLTTGKSAAIAIRNRLLGCNINTLEKDSKDNTNATMQIEEDEDEDEKDEKEEEEEEEEEEETQEQPAEVPTIFIDFVPVKALNNWIDAERYSPPDAIWMITYELAPSVLAGGTFQKVVHQMTNYPNNSNGYIRGRLQRIYREKGNSQELVRYQEFTNDYNGEQYRPNRGRRGRGGPRRGDYGGFRGYADRGEYRPQPDSEYRGYPDRGYRKDDNNGRIGKRYTPRRRGDFTRTSDVYIPDY